MDEPDAEAFLSAAEAAFAFLRTRGFSVPADGRLSTPMYDVVLFEGRHVGVLVSLDRCTLCLDVALVSPGSMQNRSAGSRWKGLLEHAFGLGYQGGLEEFRPSESAPWYQSDLQCYAAALQALAPDVLADSPKLFGGNGALP